mmetsp:Transcript_28178/g.68422  ORF Transcript_28178/g.68422 Transcript_28178/m.68422 type:complete len:639 (+) Transcript_28178:740-2656(+)
MAQALPRVFHDRLPLGFQRLPVLVELGQPLDVVRRDLLVVPKSIVQLRELVAIRSDDEHGALAVVLLGDLHHPSNQGRVVLHHFHALVLHFLARVAAARVQEARHVELDGIVRLRQVVELRSAADRARQAEDARVLVEHVWSAHDGVARLRLWENAALVVVQPRQPGRGEGNLGHAALGVEHDGSLVAIGVRDDSPVLLSLRLLPAVSHRRHRFLPDNFTHALWQGVVARLDGLVAFAQLWRQVCVTLRVVVGGPLVHDQVVHLIDDEHRRSRLLVQRAFNHFPQEVPVDLGFEAVADLQLGAVQLDAALNVELLVEQLVRVVVAQQQPFVVLENVYLLSKELHHKDGEHRNDDALPLARSHLRDEALVLGLGLGFGGGLQVVSQEARHHQDGEGLRVVRRERRQLPVDHQLHPLGGQLGEELHLHIPRGGGAPLALADHLEQQLRLGDEVEARQRLLVAHPRGAVRLDRRVRQLLHQLERLRRLGALAVQPLVARDVEEHLLGGVEALAEHVLEHEARVVRLLEERLPLRRVRGAHVAVQQRHHRAAAQVGAPPAHVGHRAQRHHAVLRHLAQHRELRVCEVLRLLEAALVDCVENAQQEDLLLAIALELVENLLGSLRDSGRVALLEGGEAEEQHE